MPEHSWRKSSHCSEGEACVYVAQDATGARISGRADGGGPVVTAGVDAWAAFVQAVTTDGSGEPVADPARY
ncbi:DUF397 domain-containing protein [Streptomyces sp. NPDC086023]|uniref:DUF397 domain-containing protein n=1 Tax=Streptomyces sp. NPDC086023 TaxID=3365746 RepID=UPI0037CDE7A9